MNKYVETYQPFKNGPLLVNVIEPFKAEDFTLSEVYVGGAEEARETYTKYSRYAKRYVEGGRRVELTENAFTLLLDELGETWVDSTDRLGKEFKRRWNHFGGGFGNRKVPGFDDTFADWITLGISKRVKLTSKSPKEETRQLEIDATRERVRRHVTSEQAVEDWVDAYNKEWADYTAWTAEKLTEYVAQLIKELQVNDEWLDEQMAQDDVDKLDAMNAEITRIEDEIKGLVNRKVQLRERIYDKSRSVLETHLATTQDPVLLAVFEAAIESVKDEKPAMRTIFEH
jgi:hypothetical protein